MGYVTKYGSFWGFVPQTSGNVHWVAPAATYTLEGRAYSASDGNDGLSPERALLTLNQAITNATANVRLARNPRVRCVSKTKRWASL